MKVRNIFPAALVTAVKEADALRHPERSANGTASGGIVQAAMNRDGSWSVELGTVKKLERVANATDRVTYTVSADGSRVSPSDSKVQPLMPTKHEHAVLHADAKHQRDVPGRSYGDFFGDTQLPDRSWVVKRGTFAVGGTGAWSPGAKTPPAPTDVVTYRVSADGKVSKQERP